MCFVYWLHRLPITDHAKDTDVVMPMYNLIEHNDSYSETCGSLCQYYRHKPVINNDVIVDAPYDLDSASFKYKQKIKGQTGNDGTKMFK